MVTAAVAYPPERTQVDMSPAAQRNSSRGSNRCPARANSSSSPCTVNTRSTLIGTPGIGTLSLVPARDESAPGPVIGSPYCLMCSPVSGAENPVDLACPRTGNLLPPIVRQPQRAAGVGLMTTQITAGDAGRWQLGGDLP